MKNLRRIWSISLIAAGTASLLLIISSCAGIDLPDTVKRILGLTELAAIFGIAFTTIKLMHGKENAEK